MFRTAINPISSIRFYTPITPCTFSSSRVNLKHRMNFSSPCKPAVEQSCSPDIWSETERVNLMVSESMRSEIIVTGSTMNGQICKGTEVISYVDMHFGFTCVEKQEKYKVMEKVFDERVHYWSIVK